jgi:hypothetical protein
LHHVRKFILFQRCLGEVHDDRFSSAPEGAKLCATLRARFHRLPTGYEDAQLATLDRRSQLLSQRASESHLGRIPELEAAQFECVGNALKLGFVFERMGL